MYYGALGSYRTLTGNAQTTDVPSEPVRPFQISCRRPFAAVLRLSLRVLHYSMIFASLL
jgi:hypothetical protein